MAMLRTLLFVFLFVHHGYTKDTGSNPRIDPGRRDTLTDANEVIAFSAELSTHRNLPGDVIIEFDRTLTNAGERYFNTTGQFACADDHLYVFIWSLRKLNDNSLEGMRCISELHTGATDQKFGPKSSYHSTIESGVAEMTAMVQCTTSPLTAVTVRTIAWSPGGVAWYDAQYTSFSGFRLLHDIGFTAELSEDQNLFAGSKVRFDRVLSNYGGYYDENNHFFECPDDGVYVFSVSTYCRDPDTPWSVSRLIKDGEVVLQGPITFRATADYDSGSASTTTVLQCTLDSSVYVEAQAAHDFSYNSYGAELTSFTGFKLYNDTEGAVAFTAIMSNNHTTGYEYKTFVFDQIVTNFGEAFDPDSSEFVCPDDDYYLFTWSVTADYGGSSSLTYLYMDDTPKKYMRLTEQSTSDGIGTSGSSSISIIQQCSVGSRFYIVGISVNPRVYLGGYTSFSGYKIPY